jgi:predicted nucleic acid-binding protein
MNIVIDTNIFISALIKGGITREILLDFNYNFLLPEFELEEINKHKNMIIKKAGLSIKEFDTLFLRLLKYVRIIPTDMIIYYKKTASEIIGNIDPDDVPFIACALAFNCPIWSDDKHFKKQTKIKIFTTKDLVEMCKDY